jgi:hypothetical protein
MQAGTTNAQSPNHDRGHTTRPSGNVPPVDRTPHQLHRISPDSSPTTAPSLGQRRSLQHDLKDPVGKAVVPAVVWKNQIPELETKPQVGTQILAFGKITVYAPHGKYQCLHQCESFLSQQREHVELLLENLGD